MVILSAIDKYVTPTKTTSTTTPKPTANYTQWNTDPTKKTAVTPTKTPLQQASTPISAIGKSVPTYQKAGTPLSSIGSTVTPKPATTTAPKTTYTPATSSAPAPSQPPSTTQPTTQQTTAGSATGDGQNTWNPNIGEATNTGGGMSGGAEQYMNEAVAGSRSLVEYAMQSGADIQAMVLKGLETTLAMISQMESQILQQFQSQMGQEDPAMRQAINSLKEEAMRQRQMMLESMNSRGLTQSGIMLEMEDRMNRGELTQIQQMVSGRMSELQNQINQALMSFAQAKLQAQQTFTTTGINAAIGSQGNVMQAMGNLNSTLMQGAGMQQGAYQFNVGRNDQNYWQQAQMDFQKQQDLWKQQMAQKELELAQYNAQTGRISATSGGGGGSQANSLQAYQNEFMSAQQDWYVISKNWENGQMINPLTKMPMTKADLLNVITQSDYRPEMKQYLLGQVNMLPDAQPGQAPTAAMAPKTTVKPQWYQERMGRTLPNTTAPIAP